VGSVLSGGLRDLIERFKQNGQGIAGTPGSRRVPINPWPRSSYSKRLALRC
jgi:hypothetical protein